MCETAAQSTWRIREIKITLQIHLNRKGSYNGERESKRTLKQRLKERRQINWTESSKDKSQNEAQKSDNKIFMWNRKSKRERKSVKKIEGKRNY